MKPIRLFLTAALLFAFCLRAGGQPVTVSQYHLTLGPEWTQDLISGQDYFVWIEIDRTGTLPVVTSIVYSPEYLGTNSTQMQIKTIEGATCDPFALLEIGDVILSDTPGVFSVGYSARWTQANGVLSGGYISVLQCARDAGFIYIPPNRGCDNLFLPVANVTLIQVRREKVRVYIQRSWIDADKPSCNYSSLDAAA